MKRKMNDAFLQHFEEQSLNSDQIAELDRLINGGDVVDQSNASGIVRVRQYFAAALIAMLLISVGWYQWFESPGLSMPEKIAAEVAKNHLKRRPLEVSTQSMMDIQQYFTELDFMPTRSSWFPLGDQQLLGARYCSIQGVTAAQLRYSGAQDETVTLYEAPYDADIFKSLPNVDAGELPLQVFSKGLQVKIWVEKDVLMVSAAAQPLVAE